MSKMYILNGSVPWRKENYEWIGSMYDQVICVSSNKKKLEKLVKDSELKTRKNIYKIGKYKFLYPVIEEVEKI